MISGDMYNYINVLDRVADASNKRLEIINGNLANVSTPDYKRKDLDFESFLEKELARSGTLNQKIANVNLDRLDYLIYTDKSDLRYRLDGNNVDVDVETSYQAQEQIRYSAILDSITNEFSKIRAVLKK